MTATQLRHAKLWFAGEQNNWDLAAYEIDEVKEGLEDAARLFPTFDDFPVAEMIKTTIDPRIEEVEKAVRAKSSTKFVAAFDELTSGCNSCHAAASKPFIRIQRPMVTDRIAEMESEVIATAGSASRPGSDPRYAPIATKFRSAVK